MKVQQEPSLKLVKQQLASTRYRRACTGLTLLRSAGVSVVAHQRVDSQDEAVVAAAAFDYPVVMKSVSADIAHKSDIGGVRLHLQDAGAVRAAYREILGAAARHAPAACRSPA
ncbi:acetate--CoA ligase family protein [Cupriavidus necator]|uniref:acetate--CoA ligase family protein n=1 Tax=Cupriavidus necator TaxID=106590 RepID=UPI003ECFA026